MKGSRTLLIVLVLVGLILSGCAPAVTPEAPIDTPVTVTEAPAAAPTEAPVQASPTTPSVTEITVALGDDPLTLDPQASDDGNAEAVLDNVYEGLVVRDQDMKVIPLLAESWEQIDETTARFHLRQGVAFSNGEPLDAEAVVYSVERMIDPEYETSLLAYFETIAGAEVVDDATVDILTKGPDPILPARLTWLKIVPPGFGEFIEASPDKSNGTGPYQVTYWARGDRLVLEKVADYWGDGTAIDRVTFRPIVEEATRLSALQAGEVDLVRNIFPEQLAFAPKAINIPGLEFALVKFNTLKGPLTDQKIRQAINYAVDKEAIVSALYQGHASIAPGQPFEPAHTGFNPDLAPYPYDPDKARALLDEAGYNGEEILFVSSSGRWLKDRELAEVVAGQLAQVGLNVKLEIREWSAYLDAFFAQEDRPPMVFVAHANPLLDVDRTLSGYFVCGARSSSYCDEALDKLIADARIELDEAKRQEMNNEILKALYEDAAVLYLVRLEDTYGLSERLQWEPRLDSRIYIKTATVSE